MRRRDPRLACLVVATILAGVCGWPSHGQAYCRSTTCDQRREACPIDPATGCVAVEVPFTWRACLTGDKTSCVAPAHYLAWPTACVGYDVHRIGTEQVPFSQAQAAVDGAFQTWNSVACEGGRALPITTRNLGPVACGEKTYNQDPDTANANVVMFVSPWVEDPSALALTTVNFSTRTGTIVDADLEVNDDRPLSATELVPGSGDLQSVITHEVGHFLGLSHTQPRLHAGAVMYEFYETGTDRFRTLTPDDVEGICAAYSSATSLAASDCQPVHGWGSECAQAVGGGCCAIMPSRARTPRGALVAVLALLLGFAARRRRVPRGGPSARPPLRPRA